MSCSKNNDGGGGGGERQEKEEEEEDPFWRIALDYDNGNGNCYGNGSSKLPIMPKNY